MTRMFLVLASLPVLLFVSCGGKEPRPPRPALAEMSAPVPPPPAEEVPLSMRLDQAVAEADKTHKKHLGFIDEIFKDEIRQGRSIACSGFRILSLDDQLKTSLGSQTRRTGEGAWTKYETYTPNPIGNLAQNQKFIAIKPMGSGVHIQVPLSKPYAGKHTTGVGYSDCQEHYREPVPNNPAARDIEKRSFAEEIVRALRRLDLYEAKLPVIETEASRTLALEATLRKMREDLEFDLLDPTIAVNRIREYENFLNTAVNTLADARKEVAVETRVKEPEIDDVLRIISGEAPKEVR